MDPVFVSQPVAWERSIGQYLSTLVREKYLSNTSLYYYILLAGNSLNSIFLNSLASAQCESQLNK